jgi:hypothetical protein
VISVVVAPNHSYGRSSAGHLDQLAQSQPEGPRDAGIDGQWEFLAPDALRFARPAVGIEFGQGEKFVAGLFDRLFNPQPAEQRALGLLLAGRDFDQAPEEIGANGRPVPFHL